jgi:hypothetical protein
VCTRFGSGRQGQGQQIQVFAGEHQMDGRPDHARVYGVSALQPFSQQGQLPVLAGFQQPVLAGCTARHLTHNRHTHHRPVVHLSSDEPSHYAVCVRGNTRTASVIRFRTAIKTSAPLRPEEFQRRLTNHTDQAGILLRPAMLYQVLRRCPVDSCCCWGSKQCDVCWRAREFLGTVNRSSAASERGAHLDQ